MFWRDRQRKKLIHSLVFPDYEKMTPLEEEYLKSLSEKEYMAYEIAKSHLGTSFQLDKSNGFLKWKEEQTKK